MNGLHATEMPLCLALNRWGAHSVVHGFFAMISRLGNGLFWYVLMASLALYRAMKRRIRRPRPSEADSGVVARIAPLDQFSFPSGHTLHAVAFTIVGCFWFPSLAIVLIPFTVLVAVSRIVLGLHYPSDVLAAIGIGATVAGASLLIV
jgi:undecaprenyl-diphosphatase